MRIKNLARIILLLLGSWTSFAYDGQDAYLYIQGDKQHPFYVKLEDTMQARYGKDYCIIPKLASGPAHIAILFQQNAFPPLQFTILMPESGSRGFMLVKKEDSFMLYDLQQDFYLLPGNTESEDHLPVMDRHLPVPVPNSPIVANGNTETAAPAEEVRTPVTVSKPATVLSPADQKEETPKETEKPKAEAKPVFIPDLELIKDRKPEISRTGVAVPAGLVVDSSSGTQNTTVISRPKAVAIVNSDCPQPLSNQDFSKVFNGLNGRKTDEERLDYFSSQLGYCYASWQARTLVGKMETDAARYELLHKIYPRITDQSEFPLLDDVLTTDIWKAEFLRLVHPK